MGILSYGFVRLNNPQLTLPDYTYSRYQSNERYTNQNQNRCDDKKKDEHIEDSELTKKRLADLDIELAGEKRSATQDITKQIFSIILCLLVFSIHWRLARKARLPTQ